MSVLYKTVAKESHIQQIIEKSKFIAHIKSVSSREEAEDFIASIKQEYKDATHNVPAFVIGDKMQAQWGSDDGEPQGTAAAPIVQMLVGEGLTNVCVVVTRYFGGIKLGTGGLIRAYTSSAKLALEDAGIYEVRNFETMQVEIPYNLLDKLQNMEKDLDFDIISLQYGENITAEIRFEAENLAKIEDFFIDFTRGNFKKIVNK